MLDPAQYPGHVAAAAPRLALDFARERGGEEAWRRVVDGCAAAGIDLSRADGEAWVPFAAHLGVLARVERALEAQAQAEGEDVAGGDVLWDLGLHNARNAHRFIPGLAAMLALVRPARLIQSAPLVWRTYADFGPVASEAWKGGGRLSVSGFPPHSAFCGTLGGFFAGLLTRVGAHACAVEHTECMVRGAPACTFTGTWT